MGAGGGAGVAGRVTGRPSRSKSTANFTVVFLRGFSAIYPRLYRELSTQAGRTTRVYDREDTNDPGEGGARGSATTRGLGKGYSGDESSLESPPQGPTLAQGTCTFLAKTLFGIRHVPKYTTRKCSVNTLHTKEACLAQ